MTQLCPDTTSVLTLPNETGVLATKADVDLAANSGRMITDQGVWYAKMYAATVAPAAEDGTNYADFSQVDAENNPVIKIYTGASGVWTLSETITPPAEYDGYVPVTSKIWDIAEQTGQQGGRVLWNHQSKEFTPYPQIISFEDINVTGNSTVDMPQNPGANQIVNKDYVDDAIAAIPAPTVDILMPDYSQGQNVALTGITQWTAPIDCFVSYQSGLQNTAATELKIGNKRVAYFSNPFSGFVYTTVTFYMKAGQILTGLSDNDVNRDCGLTYYPLGA